MSAGRLLPDRLSLRGVVIAVNALAFVGYVLVARGLDNLYPFSTFDMYSQVDSSSASRVVARDADGTLREVTAYRALDCEGRLDVSEDSCGTAAEIYRVPYKDEEAVQHVETHRGASPDAAPVDIVRHVWKLSDDGSPALEKDCVLVRCVADLR